MFVLILHIFRCFIPEGRYIALIIETDAYLYDQLKDSSNMQLQIFAGVKFNCSFKSCIFFLLLLCTQQMYSNLNES